MFRHIGGSELRKDAKHFVLCPRWHGLVVRLVACEARGPGFDSSSRLNGFFSSGIGVRK